MAEDQRHKAGGDVETFPGDGSAHCFPCERKDRKGKRRVIKLSGRSGEGEVARRQGGGEKGEGGEGEGGPDNGTEAALIHNFIVIFYQTGQQWGTGSKTRDEKEEIERRSFESKWPGSAVNIKAFSH